MNEPSTIIDFNNLDAKRRFMSHVGTLRGLWEVQMKERHSQRTMSQNRYWHSCVVEPFREWLQNNGNGAVSHDQAHAVLRDEFLPAREIVGPFTGEVRKLPASTAALDKAQFADLIDRVAKELAEFCGVVIPEPDRMRIGA